MVFATLFHEGELRMNASLSEHLLKTPHGEDLHIRLSDCIAIKSTDIKRRGHPPIQYHNVLALPVLKA